MPQFMFPDNRFRSPTAVQDQADRRMDFVYSALVLAHGGTGTQRVFVNPKGQTIPSLAGSSIAATEAHQTVYTEVTTSMDKAGELGNSIGDIGIRAIGITLEQTPYTVAGAPSAFGATQLEVADVCSKVAFELKVGGKKYIGGPAFGFPAMGGVFGSIATTANAVTQALANNGSGGNGKRLRIPILVARNDTLEGVLTVPRNSLVFRTTTGAGAATLAWVVLDVASNGDVR